MSIVGSLCIWICKKQKKLWATCLVKKYYTWRLSMWKIFFSCFRVWNFQEIGFQYPFWMSWMSDLHVAVTHGKWGLVIDLELAIDSGLEISRLGFCIDFLTSLLNFVTNNTFILCCFKVSRILINYLVLKWKITHMVSTWKCIYILILFQDSPSKTCSKNT